MTQIKVTEIICFFIAIVIWHAGEFITKWALKKWPKREQVRWIINKVEYVALFDLPQQQVQDFYKWSDSIPKDHFHPFAWHVEFEQFSYVAYEDRYRLQVNKAICIPVVLWDKFLAQRIEVS